MINPLVRKINIAIKEIQKAESLALQYQNYGFHLAFSGGKDSEVILHLAKMAKVKYKLIMNITTLDPPELMKFVRLNYPEVSFIHPKMNFYKLIIKKNILPTRQIRFCCRVLKEQGGANTVTMLGIRKEESVNRSKRNELEITGYKYSNTLDQFNIDQKQTAICLNGKDKIVFSPIIDWTTSDVWNFIRMYKLKYCELYDIGYKRIGCMFCPMASPKYKYMDEKRYPRVKNQIIKSISEVMKTGVYTDRFESAEAVFDWWISNLNVTTYMYNKSRTKLF